jgi:hypothetical protein
LWYAENEPAIHRQIRFTWLRSFSRPVIVRFSQVEDALWTIRATELSGAGGYDPGTISRSISRELTEDESGVLLRLVDGRKLLRQPVDTCEIGLDGAAWIVEGLDADSYSYLSRWTPSQGAVHEFGLYAIELTGWEVGEIY